MSYVVKRQITGLRNGVEFPKVGEPIDVTSAEVEDYLRLGIITEVIDPELTVETATPPTASVETATGKGKAVKK